MAAASCRGSRQGSVRQGPPNIRTVAKGGMSDGVLRDFLSHPHGAMPGLALTRAGIEDLIQ
jgi:hypothetical protein